MRDANEHKASAPTGVVWTNQRVTLTKDMLFGFSVLAESGWVPFSMLAPEEKVVVKSLIDFDETPWGQALTQALTPVEAPVAETSCDKPTDARVKFNPSKFSLPPTRVPFYTLGIEVGSDEDVLCRKLSHFRYLNPDVLYTRMKGLQIVVRLSSEGVPEVFEVHRAKSMDELSVRVGAGVCDSSHPVGEDYRSPTLISLGAGLLAMLKETGLWAEVAR